MEAVRHNIVVPADTSKLCELRDALFRLSQAHGVPPKAMRRMVLAIDEALANVIEHACLKDGEKEIELSLKITQEKIEAAIADKGLPFDPCQCGKHWDRNTYPRRGFGLYMIHMIVDSMEYERTSEGRNVLTLTKNLE
jgi:serine/threonine-protein kinase RsbW